MPTRKQNLYEETNKDLGNLKTDKNKDQVFLIISFKMCHCFSYDVHNNNIEMDFLNKVEVIVQYRQSVMNTENVGFLQFCITSNSQTKGEDKDYSIKRNPDFVLEVNTYDLFPNFK